MKQYFTLNVLAWLFNLDKSSISRCIHKNLNLLHESLADQIIFPTFLERFYSGEYIWRYFVALILDGSEQPIHESKKKFIKNITYSNKKKQHSLTKLIFCNSIGKIVFLSKSYVGSISDLNLAEMPENSLYELLQDNEFIIGDSGFQGLSRLKIISYATFKDTSYKKTFLRFRSVIENVIAMIKSWKICKLEFRAYKQNFEETKILNHKVWTIVSCLCNLYHDTLR
jgi:hypothetical protein